MYTMYCPLFTGDADFAEECHNAYLRGQKALDHLLWNETAKYYNAYVPCPTHHPCTPHAVGGSHPNVPGAIMTDTFYAQVSYSLIELILATGN